MARIWALIAAWIALLAAPALAHDERTPREIVERGIEAHGGELFLRPGTLVLSGSAVFFDGETGDVRSRADNYRMWREMDPDRQAAHGAAGKVRIIARSGEQMLFEVGYDGVTTWTQNGIMPKPQADAYWANNFGFGIVRQALSDGFTLHRAPSRDVLGRSTAIVRVVDPRGQATLFGFDQASGLITYMAFDSARGFHERLYADFLQLQNGWVQARSVTLLYDGIVSNTVYWDKASVGEVIDPEVFTPPHAQEDSE